LLCAELNDSTKLSGTILNNATALARRASLRMRRVSLQQVRVERSETTEPLAATARRASEASHPARPTNVKKRPKGAFLLCAELRLMPRVAALDTKTSALIQRILHPG
jgi:hypothetical protein